MWEKLGSEDELWGCVAAWSGWGWQEQGRGWSRLLALSSKMSWDVLS